MIKIRIKYLKNDTFITVHYIILSIGACSYDKVIKKNIIKDII